MSGRRGFLALTASAVAASAVPPIALASAAPNPDAALISLGAEFDRANKREVAGYAALSLDIPDDDPAAIYVDELNDATSKLVDRIAGVPATTLEGVLVKARALMWCRCSEPITALDFAWNQGEAPTTEAVVLAALLNDLVAIPGGSSVAILGSVPA